MVNQDKMQKNGCLFTIHKMLHEKKFQAVLKEFSSRVIEDYIINYQNSDIEFFVDNIFKSKYNIIEYLYTNLNSELKNVLIGLYYHKIDNPNKLDYLLENVEFINTTKFRDDIVLTDEQVSRLLRFTWVNHNSELLPLPSCILVHNLTLETFDNAIAGLYFNYKDLETILNQYPISLESVMLLSRLHITLTAKYTRSYEKNLIIEVLKNNNLLENYVNYVGSIVVDDVLVEENGDDNIIVYDISTPTINEKKTFIQRVFFWNKNKV